MNKKVLSAVLMLGMCLIPLPSLALTLRAQENISVGKEENVRGDLYAAGASVSSSGAIEGDLIAVGGRVIIVGPVGFDLAAAGGTVDVLGNVGDDVRVAGGQVTVGSEVIAGDLVAAGGNVHVLSSTNIRSDLLVAGGNVVLDGKVDGNVRVYGGDLTINGNVEGTVEVYSVEALSLGPKAFIKGDLIYTARTPLATTSGQVLGQVTYKEPVGPGPVEVAAAGAAFFGTLFLVKLIVTLATVLILLFVFRRFIELTTEEVTMHFARNAVIGFAGFIAVPAALFLLLITLFGIPIAILGWLIYVFSLLLAYFIAPIVAGALLAKWLVKEERVNWKWATLGFVVLTILMFIPVLGWIIPFLLFLATFGALLSEGHRAFWTNR